MVQKKQQLARSSAVAKRRSSVIPKKSTTSRRVVPSTRASRTWSKRLLMHPTSLFGLLVLGVFLAGLSYRVQAEDYSVHATVQAAPLGSGAIILDPVDGQVSTTRPIIVTGQCPNDSYVKLFRNTIFSGVAICSGNTFQIQTDLFAGMNDLQAQAYNITDQPGPETPVVHVRYSPPGDSNGVAEQPGGTTNPTKPVVGEESSDDPGATLPLVLTSDYYFNVVTTSQSFEWKLQYQTGKPAFDTRIDWGDGKKTQMSVPDNKEFTISHSYEKSGYYIILLTGTDARNRTVSMQLVAFIKKPGDAPTKGNILYPGTIPGAGGSTTGTPQNGGISKFLTYAWPVYGVTMVMLFSFWLGERREFLHLANLPRLHKR